MNKAGLADSYDYTTNAFGGWIEIGQDLSLSDSFFITPHVAANFGRISTESFKSANGLNADVDAVTSAILTLGTDVSYRTPEFEVAATVAVSNGNGWRPGCSNFKIVQIRFWHRFDYSDTWDGLRCFGNVSAQAKIPKLGQTFVVAPLQTLTKTGESISASAGRSDKYRLRNCYLIT